MANLGKRHGLKSSQKPFPHLPDIPCAVRSRVSRSGGGLRLGRLAGIPKDTATRTKQTGAVEVDVRHV